MYFISNDVRVCKLEGLAIFLDLKANQYLSVPPRCMAALDREIHGLAQMGPSLVGPEDAAESRSTIQSLADRGILTTSDASGRAATPAKINTLTSFNPGQERRTRLPISVPLIGAFLAAYSYTRTSLARTRLVAVVQRLHALRTAHAKAPLTAQPDEAFIGLVERFRRLRTCAYTAKDACLMDALVLTFFLYRQGLTPTFVIGVRTRPFEAHAWVQIGDCAVDDRLDNLQRFTPILVA